MLSPCQPEMGTNATVLGLYPTFLIKLEVSLMISLKRDSDHYVRFVCQSLFARHQTQTHVGGVHLVDGDDELSDTEGESEQSVLTGLAILGDTSLELTGTTGDDEDSAISLRGTGDHVLDKISVTGGVDDLVEWGWSIYVA